MAKKSNGSATVYEFAEKTLRGDLRDAVLGIIKRLPKPWAKMGEAEQRAAIHEAESQATTIISSAVTLIAAQDRPHIACRVAKVTLDDKGAKLAIEGVPTTDDAAIDVARLQGKRIVLTEAAISLYLGERAPARPDPDQKELLQAAGDKPGSAAT